MGKVLIIKGADFSEVAVKRVSPYGDGPVITISSEGSVTIVDSHATTIYYTTDGSTPTTNSTAYSSAFEVASGTTVKAISEYPDSSTSDVVSKKYISGGGVNVIESYNTTDRHTTRVYESADGTTAAKGTQTYAGWANTDAITIPNDATKITGKLAFFRKPGTVLLPCVTFLDSNDDVLTCVVPSDADSVSIPGFTTNTNNRYTTNDISIPNGASKAVFCLFTSTNSGITLEGQAAYFE